MGIKAEEANRDRAPFSLVGMGAGAAAAMVAYSQTSSIALPIFVFLVVNVYIDRGLADVATDEHKKGRFVYFTLQPLLMVGVFSLTFVWWGTMWLSAILGIVVGFALWELIGVIAFPEIHEEETDDTKHRMEEAREEMRSS